MGRASRNTKSSRGGKDAVGTITSARRPKVHLRMMVIGGLLCVAMLAALGRVFMLQTLDAEMLKREAANNYSRVVSLDDRRGDIRDRNGSLLALSVHRWAVTVDPQQIEDVNETAQALADIVNMSPEDIAEKISPNKKSVRASNNDPLYRSARKLIQPIANKVASLFNFPATSFDRSFELLSYFHKMEQLRIPGLYKIVRTMNQAAESASRAITADADSLRFMPSSRRRFAYVARNVDDETIRRIDNYRTNRDKHCADERRMGGKCRNPMVGVHTRPEPRRYYPKRELATQLLGLVGVDSAPLSGVEHSMNEVLSGGEYRARIVRDYRGRSMYLEGLPENSASMARSVELTIDEKIQSRAEEILGQTCKTSGARAGYAIVQRVTTGEILAAASYPSMNPNTYREFFGQYRPLRHERQALEQAKDDLQWAAGSPLAKHTHNGNGKGHARDAKRSLRQHTNDFVEFEHAYPRASKHVAFQDVYEPGSITKVFTLAAWLDSGVRPLDHLYDLERGSWSLSETEDLVIHDEKSLSKGNVHLIIQKSSNIGVAKMAMDMGREQLNETLRAFGFGQRTGSGFPGEGRGLLKKVEDWGRVEIANIAFGQGQAATGIQLVTALSALGNGGKLMRPMLVRRIVDSEGRVVKRWEPEMVRQVVSPEVARTTVDIMRSVVEPGGTGSQAYIPEYPVAGKTGTGQKTYLSKAGYSDDMWVATFFGLAPADDPELAVMVLIDEPKGKRYGGVVAAPAFQKLTKWSLRYLGIPSPYEVGEQIAWLDPEVLAERRKVTPETRAAQGFEHLAPPVDTHFMDQVIVPDFRGMTMDQVRRNAQEVGLNINYVGSGVARHQDHQPQGRTEPWSTVAVFFEKRGPRQMPPFSSIRAAGTASLGPRQTGGRP